MTSLSIHLLSHACRIYFDLAYPEGAHTIPAKRQFYCAIAEDADISDYLPPAPQAEGLVDLLTDVHPGYAFRLGSSGFPFLRLTIQRVEESDDWVCAVDTHDSWHHPRHEDAAKWLATQAANRELKSRIERAWEAEGIVTHNVLLRRELHVGR